MIRITAIYFNGLLKVCYETFIKKLKEHKSSIETNIKQYIKKITENLSKGKSRIRRLNKNIEKIKSQIKNFDENYRKIGHISGYHTVSSIIQVGQRFRLDEIIQIFKTLGNYRNALRIFNKYKHNLFNFMNLLISYSNDILKIETNHSDDFSYYKGSANRTLKKLNDLNTYVDKFDEYVKKAKLQEISDHIKIMKKLLPKVDNNVKPQFKKHIHDLTNIDFDYTEFEKLTKKIKKFNESFINKFKMANKSIELLKSIESGSSKLTDVTFKQYDIDELIKNSSEIKERLESFETMNLSDNINTKNIASGINNTQQYNDDILSYKSLISYLLDEISVVIYIHYLIQILILYSLKIDTIKNKIKQIHDIDRALNTLPDIFKDLMIVYRVHKSSMNILIVFHFISFSSYYINKNVYNFILVNYFLEILIFSIICYIIILSALKFLRELLNHIKSNRTNLIPETREIKILRAFTTNTIRCLKSIQCDIETLKSTSDNLSVNNVKDSLVKFRTFIKEISTDTNQVKNNIKFINKGILKLYVIDFKIIYIKMYVHEMIKKVISFIDHIFIYYLMFNLSMEKRYTKKEKDWVLLIDLDSIIELKQNLIKLEKENNMDKVTYGLLIQFLIYSILLEIIQIEKLLFKIDSKLSTIDKLVIDLEFAIEGVARILIQSTINNITDCYCTTYT